MNAGRRHLAAIGMLGLLLPVQGGCESIVPREDLRAIARALPPAAEVTDAQREQMAKTIRDDSGVASFEFSDFTFVSETRLPSGTGWIIGLFLGGADRP